MASRKPIVDVGGELQELPAGDTLSASVSEVDVVGKTNDEATDLIPGEPVYAFDDNGVKRARANADTTSKCIGFAVAAHTAGASGFVQTNGVLSLSTAEWDAVAGTTGGLVYGTKYYLSSGTAGRIVSTAVTGSGNWVKPLGRALSTTELLINIESGWKKAS